MQWQRALLTVSLQGDICMLSEHCLEFKQKYIIFREASQTVFRESGGHSLAN